MQVISTIDTKLYLVELAIRIKFDDSSSVVKFDPRAGCRRRVLKFVLNSLKLLFFITAKAQIKKINSK